MGWCVALTDPAAGNMPKQLVCSIVKAVLSPAAPVLLPPA